MTLEINFLKLAESWKISVQLYLFMYIFFIHGEHNFSEAFSSS